MSFLGVAVFVGLRNTEGTLIASIDKYYKETNLYDIILVMKRVVVFAHYNKGQRKSNFKILKNSIKIFEFLLPLSID